MNHKLDASYWEERYQEGYVGWDLGHISRPMRYIIDRLINKNQKILVPGAGNGFEVEYLWKKGFRNVFLLDWAKSPLEKFAVRNSDFPPNQLINLDFFDLDTRFDLILEQTFFCSLHPSKRGAYVKKMHELLKSKGILTGVFFSVPMYNHRPPYGGSQVEYKKLFAGHFDIEIMRSSAFSEPGREELEFRMVKGSA